MAQAARLNLRMQKELKLLFSDPPPGASFPLLSADSNLSSSSLSTIHAQIEGPEGTVYARGIFDIKIQIPDRYPFQPPSVTFATPVYHPNIDNGGRICLDILNLPPKGAWQPSLNIATVLTSIGLLLSEPNPDDGLMCEASREYKYNRQAFDQKARAMTEKYAKPGATGEHCMTQLIQSSSEPNTEAEDKESYNQSKQDRDSKKPCGFSRKLSLEYSSRAQKRDSDGKQTETLKLQRVFHPENHTEEKVERKELGGSPDHHNGGCQKLGVNKGKLSLESSAQLHKKDGKESKLVEPKNSHSPPNLKTVFTASMESPFLQVANRPERTLNQHLETKFQDNSKKMSSKKLCQVSQKMLSGSLDSYQTACASDEKQLEPPDVSSPQFHPTLSRGPLPLALSTNHDELQRCNDSVVRVENVSTNTIGSKAFPAGKKLSLGFKGSLQGQDKDDKENIMPIQRSVAPLTQLQGTNEDSRQLQSHLQNACTNITKTQQPRNCQNMQTNEGDKQLGEQLAVAESVVVLDSEDSDEETSGSKRGSKLSLVRKRISKRKALA